MGRLFVIICLVAYLVFLVKIYQWAEETIKCGDRTDCAEYKSDPPEHNDQEFFHGASVYGIPIP